MKEQTSNRNEKEHTREWERPRNKKHNQTPPIDAQSLDAGVSTETRVAVRVLVVIFFARSFASAANLSMLACSISFFLFFSSDFDGRQEKVEPFAAFISFSRAFFSFSALNTSATETTGAAGPLSPKDARAAAISAEFMRPPWTGPIAILKDRSFVEFEDTGDKDLEVIEFESRDDRVPFDLCPS